jgi:uncharacterized SAM-binding protein YcdF (DUF218 family)
MPSINDFLQNLELGALKPILTHLLLPPVPLIVLMLLAAWWLARKRSLLGWVSMGLLAAALWFMATPWLGSTLVQALNRPPPVLSAMAIADLKSVAPAGKTVIVVLGGGKENRSAEYGSSSLNAASLERLRYGVWLARQTGLPVGFAGGTGHGVLPGASEAEIAGRIAAQEFQWRLRFTETQSRDTSENGIYTLALLKPQGVERVVLVTHNYHMKRAVAAFERAARRSGMGVSILPAPMGEGALSDTLWPTAQGLHLTRMALREWMGVLAGA